MQQSSIKTRLAISIVSHGHGDKVTTLLRNIHCRCNDIELAVILTINIPEQLTLDIEDFPFYILVIRNEVPKGFGANHNSAFKAVESDYFCVLNPDINLQNNPFPELLRMLNENNIHLVAPIVLNNDGVIEDNARQSITPTRIARRILKIDQGPEYKIGDSPFYPNWVAGIFMLFRSETFSEVGGFDERYFMYCEDADICARLRKKGYDILVMPAVRVVHDAHRDSHHSWKYLRWHITSLLRFFMSHW